MARVMNERRGRGQPRIGPEVKTRLDESLLAKLDGVARSDGVTRAEAIRRAVREFVSSRTSRRERT